MGDRGFRGFPGDVFFLFQLPKFVIKKGLIPKQLRFTWFLLPCFKSFELFFCLTSLPNSKGMIMRLNSLKMAGTGGVSSAHFWKTRQGPDSPLSPACVLHMRS